MTIHNHGALKRGKSVFSMTGNVLTSVDFIISELAKEDHFRTQTYDARGQPSISHIVKLVAAQKLICYGVSFTAFQDYFQMGESTARMCMSELCRGIVQSPAIADVYLRRPTKPDAKRIVELHKDVHGIDGMLGSLDVTKVHWANCPTALNGQFFWQGGLCNYWFGSCGRL